MVTKYQKIKPYEKTEEELRKLWDTIYCIEPVKTFDNIFVKFYSDMFDHAFYESVNRKQKDKSALSYARLEKMLWIKDTLQDPDAELVQGYDNKTKSHSNNSRVAIVKNDYVVVIWLKNPREAKFITAYVADNSIEKIRKSPKWERL